MRRSRDARVAVHTAAAAAAAALGLLSWFQPSRYERCCERDDRQKHGRRGYLTVDGHPDWQPCRTMSTTRGMVAWVRTFMVARGIVPLHISTTTKGDPVKADVFASQHVKYSNARHTPHLSFARGRTPKHPKKSPRKTFSCIPTRPVAGEALSRHLRSIVPQNTEKGEMSGTPSTKRGTRKKQAGRAMNRFGRVSRTQADRVTTWAAVARYV